VTNTTFLDYHLNVITFFNKVCLRMYFQNLLLLKVAYYVLLQTAMKGLYKTTKQKIGSAKSKILVWPNFSQLSWENLPVDNCSFKTYKQYQRGLNPIIWINSARINAKQSGTELPWKKVYLKLLVGKKNWTTPRTSTFSMRSSMILVWNGVSIR
jgi:hypothetical protein